MLNSSLIFIVALGSRRELRLFAPQSIAGAAPAAELG